MTCVSTTIVVAISTGSMGVSHTGIGVSEYGISVHRNTVGASTHRELYLDTPWGFPQQVIKCNKKSQMFTENKRQDILCCFALMRSRHLDTRQI